MLSQDPESVVLTTISEQVGALRQVPNSHWLVFWVRNDQIGTRMEDAARNVVVVTSEGVDFPRLGVCTNNQISTMNCKLHKYDVGLIPNKSGSKTRFKAVDSVGITWLTVHAPQLDLSVISTRNNERLSWVETSPVNSAIVSFENELDEDVSVAKQLILKSLTSVLGLCVRRNIFLTKS